MQIRLFAYEANEPATVFECNFRWPHVPRIGEIIVIPIERDTDNRNGGRGKFVDREAEITAVVWNPLDYADTDPDVILNATFH